ncbi:transmembrane protein 223 [Sebastes fasciatus]|uniref:transmembrane protein 223 n=1 Tax=Sebastes fasciatus TaxID=394691 RepID=UPI003D9ECFAC
MGLERLLCGALVSTQSPRSMSSVLNRAAALYSRIVVHREPAARLLSSSTQPSRDVTLFQHDRTRFFRLLSLFCGGQLLFWTYLGHFAYTGLRDTRRGTAKTSTTTTTTTTTTTMGLAGIWSFEMNLGSNSWRFGFTLGCLAMGAGVVGLGVLFCRRSVSQVILHQGGRMVTVSTQSPLGAGRGRRITVPLSQVACHAHRHESPSFIPLRVKGHKFYFLLDKEGTVNNARLFDTTVGAYRPF